MLLCSNSSFLLLRSLLLHFLRSLQILLCDLSQSVVVQIALHPVLAQHLSNNNTHTHKKRSTLSTTQGREILTTTPKKCTMTEREWEAHKKHEEIPTHMLVHSKVGTHKSKKVLHPHVFIRTRMRSQTSSHIHTYTHVHEHSHKHQHTHTHTYKHTHRERENTRTHMYKQTHTEREHTHT